MSQANILQPDQPVPSINQSLLQNKSSSHLQAPKPPYQHVDTPTARKLPFNFEEAGFAGQSTREQECY